MSTSTERITRLRQRQAEALQADPDARLRDADELLYPAVAASVEALGLGPEDTAAAQVALQLARVIDSARDQAWAMRWLAPNLMATLEALHATPMSRSKVKKNPAPAGPSRLDQLRAVRVKTPGGMT